MDKKKKTIVFGLLGLGVLLLLLYFLFGGSKEYKITFDTNGGTFIESQTVKEGERVTRPADPTKENSTFAMWTYNDVEYDFTKEVTSDMTLKATWQGIEETAKYDIKFVVDGKENTLSLSTITEKDIEGLGYENKEGYELKWYVNDKEYDFSTPITENMTLVGKYEKVTEYTIKFNSDGGSSVESQKVKPDEKAKEPSNVTKEGYVLDGWYLNNTKYDFSTPVTKSITLKAKWSEDPNVVRFEVKFDSDGGSKVSTQKVIEDKTATEPSKPTKSGYAFNGWYLNGKKYDFKTKVTQDITLKAQWVEDTAYTVTFDSQGGSSVASQNIKKDGKATKPADPTKDGYTFTGWLLNNKTYDFNTVVTGNITLVASYEKKGSSSSSTPTPTPVVTPAPTATPTPTPTVAPTTAPTATPTPTPTPTAAADKYTVTATKKDDYSPDSDLKAYKNGSQISFRCIKFSNGSPTDGEECGTTSRNTIVANTREYNNNSSFTIVLTDGSSVSATKS